MGDDKGEKKETNPSVSDEKKKGFISRIWNAIFNFNHSNLHDFEKRLGEITRAENAVVSKMDNRSRSSRRTSRHFILFSLLLGAIAVCCAIMTTRSVDMYWKMWATLPMFLLAALSYATCSAYMSFTRMRDREDQQILERLRAERKEIIDELKEKTNYSITQQLIQRYDPDPAAKAAAATILVYVGDESSGALTGKTKDVEPVQSSGLRNRKQVQSKFTNPGTTAPNHSDQQLVGSKKIDQNGMSEHKQVAVVEHDQSQSPTQAYALICGNCRMYNGLARMEDFPFVTYYCPVCHALNKPKQ